MTTTEAYEAAEASVREALTWLGQHYKTHGSASYRDLPSPREYHELVVMVGDFLLDVSTSDGPGLGGYPEDCAEAGS